MKPRTLIVASTVITAVWIAYTLGHIRGWVRRADFEMRPRQ